MSTHPPGWPGQPVWPELLCAKLTANMSHQQWNDWVSPDIPYKPGCPDLPIAPTVSYSPRICRSPPTVSCSPDG